MLIINNKYIFDGTLADAMANYSLTPKCLCKMSIKKVSKCVAEIFYTDLEVIENFNNI